MDYINNADYGNQPAQAHMELNPENQAIGYYEGLTKREHFAAIAMQGLLVNMGRNEFNDCVVVADEAVNAADALLAALNQPQEGEE